MSIRSIISINSRQKMLKEIRTPVPYNLNDLTLDHVFHTNIIASVRKISMYGLLYILTYSL